MALTKFGSRDWLAGWLNSLGGYVQAVSLTDPAGTEYDAAAPLPVLTSATPITSEATSAVAGVLTLQTDPCTFYGANITTVATAGYMMLFDAVAAPADGTVLEASSTYQSLGLEVGYAIGLSMALGATLVFSSTGPFTKTVSATVFMSGEAV